MHRKRAAPSTSFPSENRACRHPTHSSAAEVAHASFPSPSCSTLRLPPKPAREQERPVPALSEEKCRGGAASPALAIEDVLFPFVQHAESVANFRQGNIDGTRKLVVLIFRRVAHIDPLRSTGDLGARLLCRYAVQQGFPEELDKIASGAQWIDVRY